jgi:chemotaxis protein MotB
MAFDRDDDSLGGGAFFGIVDMLSSLALVFLMVAAAFAALAIEKRARKLPEPRPRSRVILIPNELNDRVFFSSGSAAITPTFYPVLQKLTDSAVATIVTGEYTDVEVHGYTDDVVIERGCFSDNWDLGAQRATTVARYLIRRGVAANHVSAVSHGQFAPAVAGTSPEARRANRRIEIRLLRREGDSR